MFDEETGERIAAEFEAGKSAVELAAEFGCCAATIRKVCKQHGVNMRVGGGTPHPTTIAKTAEVLNLYVNEVAPVEQVARRAHLHPETVRRILKRRGVGVERRYATGERHGLWKGYRRIDRTSGYAWLKLSPDDPLIAMCNSGGWMLEHRYVMARAIGRPLASHETVHHIDGDKSNNALENLQLRQGKHGKGVALRCRCCGSTDIERVEL